jgi:choline dehydrogenase
MMDSAGEFDYVVLGAGSAGCVVAARLSESGKYRVALLEAGGDDNRFWIRTPIGMGKLFDDARVNWLYESEPEPELQNATIFLPRGKVLGGTGSINGMVYVRGQPRDFHYWRQLGNVGWDFDDVLPYFKKSEDNVRGASEYHGAGGPLTISDTLRHPLVDAFIGAGIQAGYPANADFNGYEEDGFGYDQLMTRKGRRWTTADGFLRPALKRPNFQLISGAMITRLVFKGRQAVGVEFTQNGVQRVIHARNEIVMTLGSFNTPQLLQISGVGPAGLLKSQGVDPILDLPGVGENLQDHFGPSVVYRCTRPITMNALINNPVRRVAMGLQYLLFHRGLMTTNASFGAGNIRSREGLDGPDIRLKINLWGRSRGRKKGQKGNMGLMPFSSFTILHSILHPDSRGSVRIKSADSSIQPEIRYNFFQSERDRRLCVEGVRLIRGIMAQPAMQPFIEAEHLPGKDMAADDALLEYCRQYSRPTSHASCTCKMGIDDMAVVDPRLQVRGIGGLRIMDASVMPRVVAGNPNATIVMIAEKGADMVLEDAQKGMTAAA